MLGQLTALLAERAAAIAGIDAAADQLRRAMAAQVRHHIRYRREANIGAREVPNLEEPARTALLDMRLEHASRWQALIQRRVDEGRFSVDSPHLAAYARLQMGGGVAMWWLRPSPISESELAYAFGKMALQLVGAKGSEASKLRRCRLAQRSVAGVRRVAEQALVKRPLAERRSRRMRWFASGPTPA